MTTLYDSTTEEYEVLKKEKLEELSNLLMEISGNDDSLKKALISQHVAKIAESLMKAGDAIRECLLLSLSCDDIIEKYGIDFDDELKAKMYESLKKLNTDVAKSYDLFELDKYTKEIRESKETETETKNFNLRQDDEDYENPSDFE